MNKTLSFTSLALAFILATSVVTIVSKQTASAIDLSSIKQKATNLLAGKNNSNSTSGATSTGNTTSGAGENSTSTGSSTLSFLKQKATNAIGNLAK